MPGDEMHPLLRHAHRRREIVAHAEGALARGMEGVALRLAVIGTDRRARLDRVHDDAVVDDPHLGDMGCLGKGGRDLVGIAEMVVEDEIAGHVVEKLRRIGLERRLGGGDGGQNVDIERHRLGGIARLLRRAGDDHGDGIADETHLVRRQRVPDRPSHRCSVAVRQVHHAFQRAIALPFEVLGRIDRDDALHRLRVGGVDAADDAMRVGAADEGGMELAVQREIVGIAPLATHESRVLLAGQRLANSDASCRAAGLGNMHVHRKAPQSNESRSGDPGQVS